MNFSQSQGTIHKFCKVRMYANYDKDKKGANIKQTKNCNNIFNMINVNFGAQYETRTD